MSRIYLYLMANGKINFDELNDITVNVATVLKPLLSIPNFILEGDSFENKPKQNGLTEMIYGLMFISSKKTYDYRYFILISSLCEVLKYIYKNELKVSMPMNKLFPGSSKDIVNVSVKVDGDNLELTAGTKNLSFNMSDYSKIINKALRSRSFIGFLAEQFSWLLRLNNAGLLNAVIEPDTGEVENAEYTKNFLEPKKIIPIKPIMDAIAKIKEAIQKSKDDLFNGHKKIASRTVYKGKTEVKKSLD